MIGRIACAFVFLLASGATFGARLQPADLTYQGAFLVPTTTFFETWCDYLSTQAVYRLSVSDSPKRRGSR